MSESKLAALWVEACERRLGRGWVCDQIGMPSETYNDLMFITNQIAKLRRKIEAATGGRKTLPRMPAGSRPYFTQSDYSDMGVPSRY